MIITNLGGKGKLEQMNKSWLLIRELFSFGRGPWSFEFLQTDPVRVPP